VRRQKGVPRNHAIFATAAISALKARKALRRSTGMDKRHCARTERLMREALAKKSVV